MEKLKILVPTDFSIQAEFAYLMVKKLEDRILTDIHFLHVLNVPDTVTIDGSGKIQTCGEIDADYLVKQKEIADRKLADLKATYGHEVNCHCVLGKVTDSIIDFAESNKFDLIVMGTKGAWGLKEKLSGSETQMIARRSPVPVLSLMGDRPDPDIQNILLVHNFSDPSREDLGLIQKLMNAFKARLHFLQINRGRDTAETAMTEANMKRFAELNGIDKYECHIINDKDVENGVVHFSQMNSMDIICIGTHGKGGLFHHSATEKLINHLSKPIVSFHLK